MGQRRSESRVFSLAEANALLPRLREALPRLRELRAEIIRLQTQADIEEIAGAAGPEARGRVDDILAELEPKVERFHGEMAELHKLGCELKDLEKGLVDFRADRFGEPVYLCWMEGEDAIRFWHKIEEGFKGRKEI
jgi:hypothetical protein